MAGVNDPERIKKYLQSTANLQFFELYTLNDIGQDLVDADKSLQAELSGLSDSSSQASKMADSIKLKANEYPLRRIVQFVQPYKDKSGKESLPANIGYVLISDTAKLLAYLDGDIVRNKLPDNCEFMFGRIDSKDTKTQNILLLYAVKTLPNGQAPIRGGSCDIGYTGL